MNDNFNVTIGNLAVKCIPLSDQVTAYVIPNKEETRWTVVYVPSEVFDNKDHSFSTEHDGISAAIIQMSDKNRNTH